MIFYFQYVSDIGTVQLFVPILLHVLRTVLTFIARFGGIVYLYAQLNCYPKNEIAVKKLGFRLFFCLASTVLGRSNCLSQCIEANQ